LGTSTRAAAVGMIVSSLDGNLAGMIDFLNGDSANAICPIESLFTSF
jgi:hypothetical protein